MFNCGMVPTELLYVISAALRTCSRNRTCSASRCPGMALPVSLRKRSGLLVVLCAYPRRALSTRYARFTKQDFSNDVEQSRKRAGDSRVVTLRLFLYAGRLFINTLGKHKTGSNCDATGSAPLRGQLRGTCDGKDSLKTARKNTFLIDGRHAYCQIRFDGKGRGAVTSDLNDNNCKKRVVDFLASGGWQPSLVQYIFSRSE